MADTGDSGNSKDKKDEGELKANCVICPGHSRPVHDLSYSDMTPDGYFLISSCHDGKPMIRDGKSGDWIGTFIGHKGAVWMTRLNHDCSQAISASADYTAKLWDALTGEEIITLEHKKIVKASIFSQDGKYVYTGGSEKILRIFDLARPDVPMLCPALSGPISHISLSPDPNVIITGGPEKFVRFWDQRTQKQFKFCELPSDITNMNTSLDHSLLTLSCGREGLIFYNATTYEVSHRIKMPREASCLSVDTKNKKFVTGSTAELWVRLYTYDIHSSLSSKTTNSSSLNATGATVTTVTGADSSDDYKEIACHKGHHGPVRCIAFDPYSGQYASGSEDGTIRIWNLTDTNHNNSNNNNNNTTKKIDAEKIEPEKIAAET
jgi:serine-threonine kinase receptor-associated protein